MASDAHLHPYHLAAKESGLEVRNIKYAASACAQDEFENNELAARSEGSGRAALCFALHPQLPAYSAASGFDAAALLAFLETLAREKRIAAVGEAGFDLYDSAYRATERIQAEIFEAQLEIALSYKLPLVLHIRNAIHKVFVYAPQLARLPACVFHAYQGTEEETRSIVRHGINAWFSFGLALANNHKRAIQCCKTLDAQRLLYETDAPYQGPRGAERSCRADIFTVIETASRIRGEDRLAVEAASDANWQSVFGGNLL